MEKTDSHITKAGGHASGAAKEKTSGPVPMHHRLKLGQTDGVKDPQGVGQPSQKSTIANGGRQGW